MAVSQQLTMSHVTIVNVGYRSTNYWVVSAGRSRLLIDLGYPGTFGLLRARLERAGVPLSEIKLAIATHYHIDHAGAAQELKDAGVRLVVVDLQLSAVPLMSAFTKPQDGFREICLDDHLVVACADSRALLATLAIGGEFVHTPGHSPDSISVVLDDGCAFTGDLTLPKMANDADRDVVLASWHALRERGVERVHPGHGPVHDLADVLAG